MNISEVANYTSDTLGIITLLSSAAAVLFLIKGGYLYITSSGKPEALGQAKKTIRNALIGLVIVLAAGIIVSVFKSALVPPSQTGASSVSLTPIIIKKPNDGLTQVLIDAVSAFMQNIVESATKPVMDGIIGYLSITPSVLSNPVIFNFWLVMLGITDSLFVLVVAILGLHFMSASTFGFEEVALRQLLPRIGIAFLGANISLFLADYVIVTCNALVKGVLSATGGLNHAWIMNAISVEGYFTNTTPLITLIFLILFLIVAVVLLLMYISRLILISLGAAISPLIFLLWAIPKFADFAEASVKTYIVTVFMVFVHVVTIQLAASFLTLPEHANNSLLAIAIAIGLLATLIKTPSLMMTMILYTSRNGAVKKLGGQMMNVMSADKSSTETRYRARTDAEMPRRVVRI